MMFSATEMSGVFCVLEQKEHSTHSKQPNLSVCRNARISGRTSFISVAGMGGRVRLVRAFVLDGCRKVQMSRWITVAPLQLEIDNSPHAERFPESPGCYVVYLDGQVIYIGQTKNLHKRLLSYKFNYARYCNAIVTPWGRSRSLIVKYRVPKKHGEWAMTELRLIKRLQPPGNCVGSTRKRGGL